MREAQRNVGVEILTCWTCKMREGQHADIQHAPSVRSKLAKHTLLGQSLLSGCPPAAGRSAHPQLPAAAAGQSLAPRLGAAAPRQPGPPSGPRPPGALQRPRGPAGGWPPRAARRPAQAPRRPPAEALALVRPARRVCRENRITCDVSVHIAGGNHKGFINLGAWD